MANAENAIQALAAKYSLEEGKSNDWYLCHSTHCITKSGAEKIRVAEGIKHSFPVDSHTPDGSAVAYMATFTDRAGEEVHEIGSCRTDGTANNPAKTHSHEMAMKRLKVRGILAIVAPAGQVYGSDELTAEYKQHGQNAVMLTDTEPVPQPAPMQQAAHLQPAPAAAPEPQAQPLVEGGVVLNIDGQVYQLPPKGTKGMCDWVEDLMPGWNNAMGRWTELAGGDRFSWEAKLLDHCTFWQNQEGKIYWGTDKWPNFKSMLVATDSYQGEVKSFAQKASFAVKDLRELCGQLEAQGSVSLKTRNPANGGCQLLDVPRYVPGQPQPVGAEVQQAVAGQLVDNFQAVEPAPLNDIPF